MSPTGGAVLLDRDGVIVRDRPGYIRRPDQLELLPGAAEAIQRLRRDGRRVMVLTNQSVVGRGLVSRALLDAIHARLREMVCGPDGGIDEFFVCPHRPDQGCACRKPRPGLLFAARDSAGVDLGSAVMVGDSASDIAAAHSAGCSAIRVDPGGEAAADTVVVPDLGAAVDVLLGSRVAC